MGKVFIQIGKNDKWGLYTKCYQKTANHGIIKVQSLPKSMEHLSGKHWNYFGTVPFLPFNMKIRDGVL